MNRTEPALARAMSAGLDLIADALSPAEQLELDRNRPLSMRELRRRAVVRCDGAETEDDDE